MITKNDASITNLFGSIAAAQTMVEQFPFSFGVNEKGFSCTFDLLAAIWNLCSDEPLEQKIITVMSDKIADPNCRWLQGIEETIKMALEANITSLITCDMSPLVPDRLIGGGEFLKGSDREVSFQGEGVTIPISAIDFTGVLGHCPADEVNPDSVAHYFPCYSEKTAYIAISKNAIPKKITPIEKETIPTIKEDDYILVNGKYYKWGNLPLQVNDIWKHDDFNAFLWYVKNKGTYGNLNERHKLIWDNRYKTKPYTKFERKGEHFFTMQKGYDETFDRNPRAEGIYPFSETYLESYNNHPKTKYKKKQILECRYINGDGISSDSFQFRLPASNYYKTRKLTGKKKDSPIWRINKTIFEFNHDFLMSLKLFDGKTYLCQVVHSLMGQGNLSINVSLTREGQTIEEVVDNIIDKVINLSDIEVEDCYFSFSNEDYDQMLNNYSERRQKGIEHQEKINNLIDEIKTIDDSGIAAEETTKTISNVLTQLSKEASGGETIPGSWKFNYNYQFELIRMLVYPLIRPLFSPKVVTLLLLNLNLMGDPLKLNNNKAINVDEILKYIVKVIPSIIIQIKDMINEMLYSWVIEKLTPILTIFTLRVIGEQIEAYKKLIIDMLTACAGFSGFTLPSNNRGIGNVEYVDIDAAKEEIKQTAISKTNC